MKDFITVSTLIFFVCSLVNVMLSTMKTILTVKATKGTATAINAITYGFYAIVVKQLASLSLPVTVIVTILTNVIGVYLSMWIMEKFSKDKLWKICITTKSLSILDKLKPYDIKYTCSECYVEGIKYYSIDVYSKSQRDSKIIKNILDNYKAKYHVVEINKQL